MVDVLYKEISNALYLFNINIHLYRNTSSIRFNFNKVHICIKILHGVMQ